MAPTGNLKHKKKIKKIKRVIKRAIITFVTGVFLFGLQFALKYWANNTDVFVVNGIEIDGMSVIDQQDILSLIEIKEGVRLFDIDLDPLKGKIMEHPYVASVALGRLYPSTIKIDIIEREPVAFIVLKKNYLLDRDGFLLPKLKNRDSDYDYPVITGISMKKTKLGEQLDNSSIDQSLELLRLLEQEVPLIYSMVSEINKKKDNNLYVILSENSTAIDFGSGNFKEKAIKLKYFLMHFLKDRDDLGLAYINLNYNDQVVIKEL